MPAPCDHNPPRPDFCRVCWLSLYDDRYRKMWGIKGPARTPSKPRIQVGEIANKLRD